ncbi:hypothetical protein MMC12_007305 [Toensbergia leucococca]|nr:hypothetical protein [Toensbergia leucococca]
MITRMFWGQEQFGGGFCGAGNRKGGRGRLRTLGTIESLLLLSDWHPRSMHFPPGDDGDEILVPLEEEQIVVSTLPNETLQSGKGRTIMAGWTEPALRSDRMCWSLAGASYTLACELGIFGNFDDETDSLNGDFAQASGSLAYRRRAVRVERLLYIYVTQTSGRLGFPSMLPGHVGITENFTNYEQAFLTEDIVTPQNMVETIQRCWAEVTSIMKAGNSQLFFSREKTRKLIQSGEYTELLDQLQPVLRSWQKNFESLDGDFYSADLSERRLIKTVPKYSRIVLSIEFEYMRIYTNSLALQAVLEQWTTKVGADMHNNPNNAPDQNIKFPGVILSSSLVEIYKKNECYIREVVDGSRSLLRYVVNDLFPNDYLKHAPVRTYFRILSGAMFLLKTFALGGKEEDVAISLRLLDETARALRTSVVDDVHLCLRIADLLKGLTSSIRHKFVRLVARSSINPQKANASPRKRQPEYQKYLDEARIKRREAEASSFNLPLPAMANTFGNNFSNNDNPVIGVATDNTITIMPPPDYLFTSTDYAFNPENLEPQPYDLFLPPHSSPQQHHFYSPTTTNTTNTTSSTLIPSSDWLTLDLNPLLDATQGMNGSLDQWDGSFGPEIHSNLDVLGRLVNEPYRVGEGYDLGGMGFS